MHQLSQKFIHKAAITPAVAIPPVLVGSNYLQWMVDCQGGRGVIKQFHLQSSLIRQQLDQMCAAGQTALRLPVSHMGDPPPDDTDTFNMSSEGGVLNAQCSQNLADLLAEIKKRPFQFVIVGFFQSGITRQRAGFNRERGMRAHTRITGTLRSGSSTRFGRSWLVVRSRYGSIT